MVTFARSFAVPLSLCLLGVVLLAAGALPWGDFLELADRTGPVLLFVASMSVVTYLGDRAGVFHAVGRAMASTGPGRDGGGRVAMLWIFVAVLSVVCTVFLSLDTTAVLVTPIVVRLALSAGIAPLPFALTAVWLANTASLLLPVSNLTNLLAQNRLDLTTAEFARLAAAPALVGVVVPTAFLWVIFRRQLRGGFRAPRGPAESDRFLLVGTSVVLLVLLVLLVSGIPVAISSTAAALVLAAGFAWRRPSAFTWRMVPWRPLLLTAGLFLILQTLHAHGLSEVLARVAGGGEGLGDLMRLAGVGAVAANAVNNLPAYLALEPVAGSPARLMALLIGVNLGPLVSPWASLATLLWHAQLTAMGVRVSWWGFALAGLLLVVAMLPLAVLALWLAGG
ncbi:SLC13 family permease [Arthrobacter halodurans]|uniref:SLC13 family permease n=1 Tax=Arthrobacter halodurans TaxID=516699 RepID=A0ABV4UKS0_9MICC